MRRVDELREAVEDYLDRLEFSPELGGLEDAVRYALAGGGKRIRPVVCLAAAEAAGGDPNGALPAAAALELVHSFSLVHDDLPAMDDDDERRGRPTAHVRFGEAAALLAGDALLAEAFRLAVTAGPTMAREVAAATLGMIGGQYLDVDGAGASRAELNRLKTGRLFEASVVCGLLAAEPQADEEPWRTFGAAYGFLYQAVDDVLDGDGLTQELGEAGARMVAQDAEARTRASLRELDGETSVLEDLVDELVARVP
jgi:geranylgeranyl diphosphate synthase, type II